MNRLERITTEYSEDEDRVRLTGEVAGRPPLVIWLTRRMLDRLVPALIGQIGQEVDDPAHAALLNSFAQQAARDGLAAQPPVQADRDADQWVVREVDIGRTDEAIALTFRDIAGQEVRLALELQQLHQWLAIVHAAYSAADWSSHVWPDWLDEAQPTGLVPPPLLN